MIILSEYGSAIFLARKICRHKDRRDYKELSKIDFVSNTIDIDGKEVKCDRVIPNPNYNPYKIGELELIQQEENIMIYNHLKENYPEKDYAEKFKKENICKGS